MASKGQKDRLTFRWTAPKGLLTIVLFLALALISEFVMVSFFAGAGLTEMFANLLPVSPLFHLLPLAVIVVLVSSWIYLTKHVAMGSRVKAPVKGSKIRRRHPRRSKTRQTSTQNTVGAIKKVFSKIAYMFSSSSRVSVTQRRLTFSRAALESTVTVLTIFLLSIILLSVLVYPNLFTDFAVGFYSTTSPLQGFMQALANVLVPIASGLKSIAPGFRNAFEGLVTSQSLTGGDLLWGYVFCQSAAACVSAISALVYVRYFIKTHRSSR